MTRIVRCDQGYIQFGSRPRFGERAMIHTVMYVALIASFGLALTLLAFDFNQAFGGSGGFGGPASTHSTFHPSVTQSLRRHRAHDAGAHRGVRRHRVRHAGSHRGVRNTWPIGSNFNGRANSEPEFVAEPTLRTLRDSPYTCSLDIPWDYVHRCPPRPEPPSRPYATPSVPLGPACSAQQVKAPARDGKVRTVNIVRC
jgi:hypothetical protein